MQFPDLTKLLMALFYLVLLLIPFALWKVVEVIIWLFRNINVSLG
jgi:hypothetical protein